MEEKEIAESIKIGIAGNLSGMVLGEGNSHVTSEVDNVVKQASSDGLRQAIDDSFNSGVIQQLTSKSNLIKVDEAKARASLEQNLLDKKSAAVSTVSGFVNEGLVNNVTGAPVAGGGARLDFPYISDKIKERLVILYVEIAKNVRAADGKPEAKGTEYTAIAQKFVGEMDGKSYDDFVNKDFIASVTPENRRDGFASGGGVSDTVPALLTPGEFVLNKKAAASIGAANLDRMNKKGVQGFAKGGIVQRFADGGGAKGGMSMAGGMMALSGTIAGLNAVIGTFGDKSLDASDGVANVTIAAEKLVSTLTAMIATIVGTVIVVNKLRDWSKKAGDGLQEVADGSKGAKQASEEQSASEGGGELSDEEAASAMAGAASQQNVSIPAELEAKKAQQEQQAQQAQQAQQKAADQKQADDMAGYVHASEQAEQKIQSLKICGIKR